MSKKQKIYTAEFKAEAIKTIEENKEDLIKYMLNAYREFLSRLDLC